MVVVSQVQLQVLDLLENGAGEEIVELQEGGVDHGVQVLNDEGLAMDDFRGFVVDLLVEKEDGWSGLFLEFRILVAGMGQFAAPKLLRCILTKRAPWWHAAVHMYRR